MENNNSNDLNITGGYESFTERGGFEDICSTYDSYYLRYFFDGASELIDEINNEISLDKIDSLLDIGTGTGHLSLEVAKRYPNCKVVGIDNSLGMLSKAKKKKGDINNIEFFKHNWEELYSFDGKFDVVTNSFGISFIENIDKFSKSVASKVKPKGLFAFINFDNEGFEPFATQMLSDLQKMSLLRRLPTSLAPGNNLLIRQMEIIGFETVKYEKKKLHYTMENVEQWWTICTRTAIKENFFYHLSDKELEEFKVEHLKNVQKLIDEGRNEYDVTVVLYMGRLKMN